MAATPLHCSLYELCREQIAADREFMISRGLKAPPPVDSALFEEYRLFKLRRTVAYAVERSRFYKRLFAKAGIEPGDIRSTADLTSLSLTSSADVAADPYAFLCVSQGMVERVITFTSSGTTGPKKRVFFSEADIQGIIDYMAIGMKTVADSSDVVQVMLPEGLIYGQSHLLARGVAKMGARPVVTGMSATPAEQVETIRENGSTVMFGETHYIYRITKAMERQCDLASLGMRTLFLSTGYASPVMIENLKRAWNAEISTHYGMTEMGLGLAVDCPVCGLYHFNELDVHAEVVDPETGGALPRGSSGELVFTTLGREAMPFIRYRTRDLSTLGDASAACGSRLSTIGHVKSRIESQVRLRDGSVIFPTIFHDAVFSFPEVIDYQMSLETSNGRELLIIEAEVRTADELLRRRITDSLREDPSSQGLNRRGADIQVHFRELGSCRQCATSKKNITDRREKYAFQNIGLRQISH